MDFISTAEAKSRFSEIVSRVSAGERFVIQRRERPLAVLIGTDELERLEKTAELGHRLALALGQDSALISAITDGELHPAMAAFGLWGEDEFGSLSDEITARRLEQPERPTIEL